MAIADELRRTGDASLSYGNDPEEHSPRDAIATLMIHIDHQSIEPIGPHLAIGMETAG